MGEAGETARRSIPIARPSTGEAEWLAVREPLESGWLTQGPKVAAFEAAFAERHAVRHAVATSNCTTALHLILAAMGIGPGDEVLVPAYTWVATANAVLYCGATPVFVDIDPATFNMDTTRAAAQLTSRTRAIIAVHLFGLCAEVDALRAAAPDVPLVEDAACAAGAALHGRPAGSLGYAAAFSFHPRKSITTGEGGMVTTQDATLAELVDRMRNHGAAVAEERRHAGPAPYLLPDFDVLGYNYRMTDVQAAIGLVQLGKLDAFIDERERWARYYAAELAQIGWLRPPHTPTGYRHGWQSYVCWIDTATAPMDRTALMAHLEAQGISTRPGTHAVHMLRLYRERFGLVPDTCPVARAADEQAIAIPLHNMMCAEDYEYVVEALQALA